MTEQDALQVFDILTENDKDLSPISAEGGNSSKSLARLILAAQDIDEEEFIKSIEAKKPLEVALTQCKLISNTPLKNRSTKYPNAGFALEYEGRIFLVKASKKPGSNKKNVTVKMQSGIMLDGSINFWTTFS